MSRFRCRSGGDGRCVCSVAVLKVGSRHKQEGGGGVLATGRGRWTRVDQDIEWVARCVACSVLHASRYLSWTSWIARVLDPDACVLVQSKEGALVADDIGSGDLGTEAQMSTANLVRVRHYSKGFPKCSSAGAPHCARQSRPRVSSSVSHRGVLVV